MSTTLNLKLSSMLDLLFHFMDSCINYSQVMEHQTQRGETLKNGHELKEIHEKKKRKKITV